MKFHDIVCIQLNFFASCPLFLSVKKQKTVNTVAQLDKRIIHFWWRSITSNLLPLEESSVKFAENRPQSTNAAFRLASIFQLNLATSSLRQCCHSLTQCVGVGNARLEQMFTRLWRFFLDSWFGVWLTVTARPLITQKRIGGWDNGGRKDGCSRYNPSEPFQMKIGTMMKHFKTTVMTTANEDRHNTTQICLHRNIFLTGRCVLLAYSQHRHPSPSALPPSWISVIDYNQRTKLTGTSLFSEAHIEWKTQPERKLSFRVERSFQLHNPKYSSFSCENSPLIISYPMNAIFEISFWLNSISRERAWKIICRKANGWFSDKTGISLAICSHSELRDWCVSAEMNVVFLIN